METVSHRFIHLATPNPASSDLQFSDMSALKTSRLSLDGGYESLLSTSSASFFNSETSRLGCSRINEDSADSYSSVVDDTSNSASSSSNSNSNPIFSQPTTPVKTASFKFNSATTPDFKQQYIADVNSFYFASIHRSSTKPSVEIIESPIKHRIQKSNFGEFSASTSNSPIQFAANSPKFVLNPGDFINQRDTFNSKLLRSPAFKLNSAHPYQPAKPAIRSFSSRLESNAGLLARATPTEEEFMELLFKNKHLPNNPEFLIGRNMGVDFVDVVGELSKRSMNNVLDNVFKYLGKEDLVRAASVNKQWRACLKQNRKFNKKRVEFIKYKKNIYETTKENRDCDKLNVPYYEVFSEANANYAGLSQSEKRAKYRKRSSFSISGQHQSFVFAQIDPNCLSNSSMDVSERASLSRPSLLGEIGRAGSSILDRVSERAFETEFKRISIADLDKENDVGKSKMGRKGSFSSSSSSSSEKLASPKFIAKHLKLSPSKKQGSEVSHARIDLIGSKKSKKNLKRL